MLQRFESRRRTRAFVCARPQTNFFLNSTITASTLLSRDLLTELITTDVQGRLQNIEVSVGATFEIIRGVAVVDRPVLFSRADYAVDPTNGLPLLPTTAPLDTATFGTNVTVLSILRMFEECAQNWQWSQTGNLIQNRCSKLQEFMAQNVNELKLNNFWTIRFPTNTTMVRGPAVFSSLWIWIHISDSCFSQSNLLTAAFSPSQFAGITLREAVNNAFVYDNATFPGFIATTNFQPYYEQCKPNECRYVETRLRTPEEVIAVVFGLIGGVTSVIGNIVTTIGNRESKDSKKETEAQMARQGGDRDTA